MGRISVFVYLAALVVAVFVLLRLGKSTTDRVHTKLLRFFLIAFIAQNCTAVINFFLTYALNSGLMEFPESLENAFFLLYVLYILIASFYTVFISAVCFVLTERTMPRILAGILFAIQFAALTMMVLKRFAPLPPAFPAYLFSAIRIDLFARIFISLIFLSALFFVPSLKRPTARKAAFWFLILHLLLQGWSFAYHDVFPSYFQGHLRALLISLDYLLYNAVILTGIQPFLKAYFKDMTERIEFSSEILNHFRKHSISEKERIIIQGICRGKLNKEIAYDLAVPLSTVKYHSHRIYQKLDLKNRVELNNLINSMKN